jgi:hypothetical protein
LTVRQVSGNIGVERRSYMTDTTRESWDERIAREKREEAATVNTFVEKLLNDVCPLLPGWTASVQRFSRDDDSPSSVTFNHVETGAAFWVSLPCRYASRHGKVEAIAEWPKDADGERKDARSWQLIKYGEDDPYRIGFSYSKTGKAIAGDLNRRLIPLILEGIASINEKLAAQKAEQAGIASDVTLLVAALPDTEIREQSYCNAKIDFGSYDTIRGDVKLSNYNPDGDGNRVDIEILNLSVEQTVAIAKLIKEWK